MDKTKTQNLTIVIPPGLSHLPVEVIRGRGKAELVCYIEQEDIVSFVGEEVMSNYVFVWHRNEYKKLHISDILWMKAERSYCEIHLTGEKKILVSFPLSEAERSLPHSDFIRIHRSFIVNMKHVSYLIGNSLCVGKQILTIGREYRKAVLKRFIFLGVRNKGNKDD